MEIRQFQTITTLDDIKARAKLIATGSHYRKLGVPGEELAHNCATCDGFLYKDKSVAVIGGGDGAASEALFLANIAKSVTILNRSPLRASAILQQQLAEKGIKIITNWQTSRIEKGLKLYNIRGEVLEVDGVFINIGLDPATDWLSPEILDETKHIKTDTHHQTTIPGVFAAGDVRAGQKKQIIFAAADGAAAALDIRTYLNK